MDVSSCFEFVYVKVALEVHG